MSPSGLAMGKGPVTAVGVSTSPTAFSRAVGLYAEAVTCTAAPTGDTLLAMPRPTGLEGVVRIISHPLAILEFRVAGSATSGAGLATTAPANILTPTTADT